MELVYMSEFDELNGGILRVLILSELSLGENYGWGIAEAIKRKSGFELMLRVESLYPILHDLENRGALASRWLEAENGRPRKMYSLTDKGKKQAERVLASFRKSADTAMKVVDFVEVPDAIPDGGKENI